MPRGGKRDGAGRKKGSPTRKTRAVAERAASEGITPLEVMLQAMRSSHSAGRIMEAVAIAKDAAPYMHPRLSATRVSGEGPGGAIVVQAIDGIDERRALGQIT